LADSTKAGAAAAAKSAADEGGCNSFLLGLSGCV